MPGVLADDLSAAPAALVLAAMANSWLDEADEAEELDVQSLLMDSCVVGNER